MDTPGTCVRKAQALLTQEPRVASLIAVGAVRVLSVDHQQFEAMLRERPEISLAVMRVLITRLKEREAYQQPSR